MTSPKPAPPASKDVVLGTTGYFSVYNESYGNHNIGVDNLRLNNQGLLFNDYFTTADPNYPVDPFWENDVVIDYDSDSGPFTAADEIPATWVLQSGSGATGTGTMHAGTRQIVHIVAAIFANATTLAGVTNFQGNQLVFGLEALYMLGDAETENGPQTVYPFTTNAALGDTVTMTIDNSTIQVVGTKPQPDGTQTTLLTQAVAGFDDCRLLVVRSAP